MRESLKAILAVVLIAASIACAVTFVDDRPNATTWAWRGGSLLCAALSIGLLVFMSLRRDEVPDFLQQRCGTFFNCSGFCFSILVSAVDRRAVLHIYFQNQFENPVLASVALRPARGFFLGRPKMETIIVDVDCPAAGFGVANLPIPVPAKLRGQPQNFEVGASVKYPNGKGRRLRFQDGVFLRANAQFQNRLATTLTIAGAFAGQIVLSSPVSVTLQLPVQVSVEIPEDVDPEIRILWKLGDAIDDDALLVTDNADET